VIAEQSAEYRAAYLAQNAAIGVYTPIRDAYRAGEIGAAEYLEARAAWTEAGEAYDAAYLKEFERN
jgi:hypothetical protein